MSEANWPLIEKLDGRFQRLVGIASDEQMRRLLDNFHLVDALSHGYLDELMEQFLVIRPPAVNGRTPVVHEQLRQYDLKIGSGRFVGSLFEAADVEVAETARQFLRVDGDEDEQGRVRVKLVRFEGIGLSEALAACRSLGLKPASALCLAHFVDQFPGSVPGRLLAPGSASAAKLLRSTLVGLPCLEPGGRRSFKLGTYLLSAEDPVGLAENCVLLTVRVPLQDATEHAALV